MRMLPRQYRKTLVDVMEPLCLVQHRLMSSTAWDIPVRNGQVCPGDRAGNDVFGAIAIQGVQRATPTHQFAARELSFHPLGVFLVLMMETLQK